MDSNLYKTIKSAEDNNIDGLKRILSAANDDDDLRLLHQTTPLKNTTLHVAVQFISPCFKEIYRRCPSLLLQANSKGDTPLHIAARLGFTDAVSIFIQQSKFNCNDIDVSSTLTPVQQLVRMGNEENDTALHEAVRNHNFQIVKILTEADPSFEYFANKAGETPLYLAFEASLYFAAADQARLYAVEADGLFYFANQILQTCPSSAHVGPLGRTALHVAATVPLDAMQFRTSDIISLLLEKKPSILKEVDDFGLSALHYAAYYSRVEQVVQLLEADPSVAYIGDKDGKTALHYAAKHNRGIKTIEQLIEHSPDCWELLDNEGRNFLHVAAENGTDEVFEYFMSNNSHQSNNRMMDNLINQPDINGDTPLHLAIKSKRYNTGKIICKGNGVRKMAMNKDNLSALDFVDRVVDFYNNYYHLYALGARESWRMKHIHGDKKPTDENIMTSAATLPSEERKKKLLETVMKISETHLVVATLIATVTFAAGFTLPGGYNSDGPHKGMAVLTRKPVFIQFLISNSIAMLLSTFAVLVHFWAKALEFCDFFTTNYDTMIKLFKIALFCTFGAILFMVVAFVMGMCTVLYLRGLIIALGILGCSFLVFGLLLHHKLLDSRVV